MERMICCQNCVNTYICALKCMNVTVTGKIKEGYKCEKQKSGCWLAKGIPPVKCTEGNFLHERYKSDSEKGTE